MPLADRPYGPSPSNPSGPNVYADNVQAVPTSPLPALQTITGTAETQIINPAQPTLALAVAVPPNTPTEQIPLDLNISGYIVTGTTANVTAKVYAGNSTTLASNKNLSTSGAIAQNSATAPFYISGKLIYDSVSGKLHGAIKSLINNTLTAEAAVLNVTTGLNNDNDPVFTISVTFTFSAANAGNKVNIEKFSVG